MRLAQNIHTGSIYYKKKKCLFSNVNVNFNYCIVCCVCIFLCLCWLIF
jgi:hypothetical protein